MKKVLFLLFVVALFSTQLLAQRTPGAAQENPILLLNGTAHLGNGEVIENSAIAFDKGKLTIVADATVVRLDLDEFEVYNIAGKHIYPGLIAPYTDIGLLEIEAVRATDDTYEVGTFNPNVRSIIAYNAESIVTPTIRSNGILMAQVIPAGGRISGTSSIVQLDAWNYEDAIIKEDDAIIINWPKQWQFKGFWAGGGVDENKKYKNQMFELTDFIDQAAAYCTKNSNTIENLKFEAMCACFDGNKKTIIEVEYVKDILNAIDFAEKYGLDLVLQGAKDAHLIKELIAEKNIPIILNPVHRLPASEDDDIDLPYKTAAILDEAGITFAFTGIDFSGDTRNLPFHAGTAVSYGLDAEKAIQSMTLNTAKILGIDDTVGSLVEGKDATLFISKGDILDIRSNHIEHAFIQGRKIDLGNRQKDLYKKYMGKYGLEVKQN